MLLFVIVLIVGWIGRQLYNVRELQFAYGDADDADDALDGGGDSADGAGDAGEGDEGNMSPDEDSSDETKKFR